MTNCYHWLDDGGGLARLPEAFTYPGGERQLKEPERALLERSRAVLAVLGGAEPSDLVDLALAGQMASQADLPFYVVASYLPAARADKGAVRGLDAYADLILATGPERVVSLDVHNIAAARLAYGTGLVNVEAHRVLPRALEAQRSSDKDFRLDYVVAPDDGALDRAEKVAKALELPLVNATKHRDFATGRIERLELEFDPRPDAHYLVVDDICDGGGTFRKLVETMGVPKEHMTLWVSHAIFSGEAPLLREYFDRIWTTRSHPGWNRPGCATTVVGVSQLLIAELGLPVRFAHHEPSEELA